MMRSTPRLPQLAPEEKMTMATNTVDSSMRMKVFLAWVFVGIPLAWGVIQTLINAMKLFQ
jgi:hypothetical protein